MLMVLLLRRKIKFGQFPNFQTNCEGIYNQNVLILQLVYMLKRML